LDVSIFSPAASPRVLDEPVISVGSDQEDGVIDGITAFVRRIDTSGVQSRPVGSVDANRDWLFDEGVLEIDATISTVVGGDGSVGRNGVHSLTGSGSVTFHGHFSGS